MFEKLTLVFTTPQNGNNERAEKLMANTARSLVRCFKNDMVALIGSYDFAKNCGRIEAFFTEEAAGRAQEISRSTENTFRRFFDHSIEPAPVRVSGFVSTLGRAECDRQIQEAYGQVKKQEQQEIADLLTGLAELAKLVEAEGRVQA